MLDRVLQAYPYLYKENSPAFEKQMNRYTLKIKEHEQVIGCCKKNFFKVKPKHGHYCSTSNKNVQSTGNSQWVEFENICFKESRSAQPSRDDTVFDYINMYIWEWGKNCNISLASHLHLVAVLNLCFHSKIDSPYSFLISVGRVGWTRMGSD